MPSQLKQKRQPIVRIQRKWVNPEIRSKTLTRTFTLKYIVYGITGGFYHSKYFKRWIKCLWTILTLSTYFIVVIIGCGGYLLTTNNLSNSENAHLFMTTLINTLVFVLIPTFTYCHRSELETILDFVDKEWKNKHNGMSKKIASHMNAREKVMLYFIAWDAFFSLVFILLHPLEVLIQNPSKVNEVLAYVFPTPWLHQINSTSLYLLIFIVHFACILIGSLVLISWNPFFIGLANEIYIAFAITCDRMHQFSTQIEDAFDEIYKKFSSWEDEIMLGNHRLQLVTEEKNMQWQYEIELHRSRLFENVLVTAKEHQLLRSKIRMIKPFAEAYFSVFLPFFFSGQLSTIYIIFAQNMTPFQCAKGLIWIVGGFRALFSLTYFGKLFDDMEEMFSNHVYSIPWYYFNPHQRKTFFILLNQSTRRIRFFALKMFPFVPQTCLNISRLIYTFASFLYGEIHKRQIR